MRRLSDMSGEERAAYLNMLCAATQAVVPPGVTLVIGLLDEDKSRGHWVGNGEYPDMARLAAEIASDIERDSKSGSNQFPPSEN